MRISLLVAILCLASTSCGTTHQKTTVEPRIYGLISERKQQELDKAANTYRAFLTAIAERYHSNINLSILTRWSMQGALVRLNPHGLVAPSESFTKTCNSYGIGIVVAQSANGVIIKRFAHNSPALKVGMQFGDFVTAVDGAGTYGMPTFEIAERIVCNGKNSVQLTGVREKTPFEVIIRKGHVSFKDFISEKLSGDVGYLYFSSVSPFSTSAGKVYRAIQTLRDGDTTKFILDLRSMDGGQIATANHILNIFLPTGTPYAKTKTTSLTIPAAYPTIENELVVLVNRGTASAGEIIASALQENGRAIIVGERTAGFGSVITEITLPDETILALPIEEYFDVSGKKLEGVGVVPDISVTEENPFAQWVPGVHDPILQTGLAHLTGKPFQYAEAR